MNELEVKNKENTIETLIKSNKDVFKNALPKHLSAERFMMIALSTISKVPNLKKCTMESLISCLIDLSQLGLEPDGRKAYLIPYGDKCTLIIDYKGLVDLARRSGKIADIHADVVCKNDVFEYSFGSEGTLIHKPALKDKGDVIAAYSYVKMKDGSCSYEVMNVDDIEKIRQKSKAGSSGPWKDYWNEMAKKTVFRRHSKWLPVSSEFLTAVEKDFDVPIDITDEIQSRPAFEMPKAIKEPASVEKPVENVDKVEEKEEQEPKVSEETKPSEQTEEKKEDKSKMVISDPQKKRLFAISCKAKWSQDDIRAFLMFNYSIEHTSLILRENYDDICEFIEKNPKKSTEEK